MGPPMVHRLNLRKYPFMRGFLSKEWVFIEEEKENFDTIYNASINTVWESFKHFMKTNDYKILYSKILLGKLLHEKGISKVKRGPRKSQQFYYYPLKPVEGSKAQSIIAGDHTARYVKGINRNCKKTKPEYYALHTKSLGRVLLSYMYDRPVAAHKYNTRSQMNRQQAECKQNVSLQAAITRGEEYLTRSFDQDKVANQLGFHDEYIPNCMTYDVQQSETGYKEHMQSSDSDSLKCVSSSEPIPNANLLQSWTSQQEEIGQCSTAVNYSTRYLTPQNKEPSSPVVVDNHCLPACDYSQVCHASNSDFELNTPPGIVPQNSANMMTCDESLDSFDLSYFTNIDLIQNDADLNSVIEVVGNLEGKDVDKGETNTEKYTNRGKESEGCESISGIIEYVIRSKCYPDLTRRIDTAFNINEAPVSKKRRRPQRIIKQNKGIKDKTKTKLKKSKESKTVKQRNLRKNIKSIMISQKVAHEAKNTHEYLNEKLQKKVSSCTVVDEKPNKERRRGRPKGSKNKKPSKKELVSSTTYTDHLISHENNYRRMHVSFNLPENSNKYYPVHYNDDPEVHYGDSMDPSGSSLFSTQDRKGLDGGLESDPPVHDHAYGLNCNNDGFNDYKRDLMSEEYRESLSGSLGLTLLTDLDL